MTNPEKLESGTVAQIVPTIIGVLIGDGVGSVLGYAQTESIPFTIMVAVGATVFGGIIGFAIGSIIKRFTG
jgi:hypothetical protein